jgi:hypothetical protein
MEPEVELTNLSAVLNGLERGAQAMRRYARQATRAVQSGTYTVEAAALSRRMICESLGLDPPSRAAGKALFAPPQQGS